MAIQPVKPKKVTCSSTGERSDEDEKVCPTGSEVGFRGRKLMKTRGVGKVAKKQRW